MQLTEQQRRAITIGAAALGGLMLTQAWRRRHPYRFEGKSVVITGGSRGLGLVLARELAAEGARLTLLARDRDELERAERDLRTRHPSAEVLTIAADVRRHDEAAGAIAQAIDRFGAVDVLINNAGIIQVGPVDHMKISDYDEAMQTHFWGPLYMITSALPFMRRQAAGRIVNISSIGGRIAVPHLLPYSASKFALAGFSEGLRTELANDNITVTTVFPGLMRTGSPVNALFKGQHPREYAWFAISDSLPLASINVERAARQIINACRYGDAELVITVQAKLAILARHAAPELFAQAMTLVNNMLPASAGLEGDVAYPGHRSESKAASPPSPFTATTYRAAAANNEL
jgi:short-subunit dehydrogenase